MMNKEKKEVVSFENIDLNPTESIELLQRLAKNELTEQDLFNLFNHSEQITVKEKRNNNE